MTEMMQKAVLSICTGLTLCLSTACDSEDNEDSSNYDVQAESILKAKSPFGSQNSTLKRESRNHAINVVIYDSYGKNYSGPVLELLNAYEPFKALKSISGHQVQFNQNAISSNLRYINVKFFGHSSRFGHDNEDKAKKLYFVDDNSRHSPYLLSQSLLANLQLGACSVSLNCLSLTTETKSKKQLLYADLVVAKTSTKSENQVGECLVREPLDDTTVPDDLIGLSNELRAEAIARCVYSLLDRKYAFDGILSENPFKIN